MKIEINHLYKVINKNTVLQDISLSMESGKIYGIQGINGSGKTMLMRAIIGLIRPTGGDVTIDGKQKEFPDSIGFLIENPSFLNRYSGFENLKMLASIHAYIKDEEINKTLRRVGLIDAGKIKYKKYSLGMKQRLGIAAAIMEEPDIIILDEPTNALDTAGINLVKTILKEEKERGALLIVSCHDLHILEDVSNEIIKMESGRITNHYIQGDE